MTIAPSTRISVLLASVLILSSCQSVAETAKIAACNRSDATLDDPEMWDCGLHDQAAHQRMVEKKNKEFKRNLAEIDMDMKKHPEKYKNRSASGITCSGAMIGSLINMTCY
jgi:hypothetical protein